MNIAHINKFHDKDMEGYSTLENIDTETKPISLTHYIELNHHKIGEYEGGEAEMLLNRYLTLLSQDPNKSNYVITHIIRTIQRIIEKSDTSNAIIGKVVKRWYYDKSDLDGIFSRNTMMCPLKREEERGPIWRDAGIQIMENPTKYSREIKTGSFIGWILYLNAKRYSDNDIIVTVEMRKKSMWESLFGL